MAPESPELDFPIIGDEDRNVSTLYGMLDSQDATNVDKKGLPFTVRTVFISKSCSDRKWCLPMDDLVPGYNEDAVRLPAMRKIDPDAASICLNCADTFS